MKPLIALRCLQTAAHVLVLGLEFKLVCHLTASPSDAMDPLYNSCPALSDTVSVSDGEATIYYELRGSASSPQKVIMLMGSFGTLRHFDQLADCVASAESGATFQALTFDYRGIGKSTCKEKLEQQTSELLAQDAFQVLQEVWGDSASIHVYGASMGGMVAQKLALLLLGHGRLKSLFLAVTARNYGLARFMPIGPKFYRFMLPFAISSNPTAMIKSLLPKCFSSEYLTAKHPVTGESFGALWLKRWVDEYRDWYSFWDIDATAAQSCVAGLHHLSDQEVASLADSGTPIIVSVAEKDALIPSSAQHALAKVLRAEKYITNGGHMGNFGDFERFVKCLVTHFLKST